jgi:CheY-like chemotaxis protein
LTAPKPLRLDRLSVLVVEDDPDARALVRTLLESHGARVTEVASGRDALAVTDRERFDVIVSDIGMRGMDGYGFLAEVRRREEEQGRVPTPAIALTAFSSIDHLVLAGGAGFQRHVAKPFDPTAFLGVVAQAAGRESRR